MITMAKNPISPLRRSLRSSTNSPTKHLHPPASTSIKQEPPASPSSSPSPVKRKALSTHSPSPKKLKGNTYAPPSAYAHLPQVLPDALAPNLFVLFVGLNPGVRTAVQGHAYAHPSNLFWRLLFRSGLTTRLCLPEEDGDMPRLFGLGLTNIVGRPSRCGAELSNGELDGGVGVLEEKVRTWRPEVVCLVGKGIWDSVERVWRGRGREKGKKKGEKFEYGWQDEFGRMAAEDGDGEGREGWEGARVFVATSTSGLAAGLKPAEKERIWGELGGWVQRRRAERKVVKVGVKVEEEDSPAEESGVVIPVKEEQHQEAALESVE